MSDIQQTSEQKGTRGPGKVGQQVKENILAVFTRLGGTAAMADWAQKNQTEFYRFYARLAPVEQHTELTGADGAPLITNLTLTFVKPDGPVT